jgi:hypothetical protein
LASKNAMRTLVGSGGDGKLSVSLDSEPRPSGTEASNGSIGEGGLELVVAAKGRVNLSLELMAVIDDIVKKEKQVKKKRKTQENRFKDQRRKTTHDTSGADVGAGGVGHPGPEQGVVVVTTAVVADRTAELLGVQGNLSFVGGEKKGKKAIENPQKTRLEPEEYHRPSRLRMWMRKQT